MSAPRFGASSLRMLFRSVQTKSQTSCHSTPSRLYFCQNLSQGQRRFVGRYRTPNSPAKFPGLPRSAGGSSSSSSSSSSSFFYRWVNGRTFYRDCGIIGGGCAGFYIYNLEQVPVSGRRRFNIVSESYERQIGESTYRQILQQYRGRFLPEYSSEYRMVSRVLERLIPHTGISGKDTRWEVHVIDDPHTPNAFVIPGGKVFVFTGILPVCRDDAGVAAVLGHEIAHNVAHHSAEGLSRFAVFLPFALVATVLLNIGDLGFTLSRMAGDLVFLNPGSRQQESEADYMGLMMMSQACYDPRAALGLWQRMEQLGGSAPPEFLSTHPSNHNRIAKINEWLEAAEQKREESGCGQTSSWARDFRSMVGSQS